MESTRLQKVNRLLQKELEEIFLLEARKMQGIIITVSEVRVTSDLALARVFLSVFPSDKGKELVDNITSNTKAVRYNLGQKVGKQLRIVPNLTFHLDESLDYLEKIDKLLDNDKSK